ncbi:hypothetical protein B0J11DRAFT_575675 [Dendryphion nanum]|uniref:Zn(2)-C6 fungal-type domain-containing protein n=1 Tax=Dendryphion nanum TaxID=256645 RepID=A0A9P9EEH5_9PLEO|nr:hypothetical protein B0J11DRAFT_575675 [Dendryphion nanum]
MANFRPLQPAPMDQDQQDSQQPPQPHTRPLVTQKPKRTVTLGACVACRKRKSKCDGTRPVCTCCAQKDTDCVYELGPNEKPSQAMKRKNEEMQGELSNLRQLYDFLRLRPEQEALEILRRIRTNPGVSTSTQRIQELADFVRHGDLLNQVPAISTAAHNHESMTLPPIRMALASSDPTIFSNGYSLPYGLPPDGPTSQRRRHASDADVSARSDSQGSLPPPTSIQAILQGTSFPQVDDTTDPRLEYATRWTDVTDDKDLIVHLMSSWHMWEYKYYYLLDWDSFLEDLASGRTDFCSTLLVNALLASASFQSSTVKDRSKPFTENVITLFYKKARRLWEEAEGQDTITKLQAALLLFLVLGKHGRDKVGHSFLVEACRIARDLGLFRVASSSSQIKPQGVSFVKWTRVRAVTATMSFVYSFPAILKTQPPFPVPSHDTPANEDLFRSECSRHAIFLDCMGILAMDDDYDPEISPKPEQIEILLMRLKSWFESRPQSLEPNKNPSPENLLSMLMYHATIIRLVQPFLTRGNSSERAASYQTRALYQTRAREVASASMNELRHLLKLHETRHGWSNAILLVLHPITITSFASLEEIAIENRSNQLHDATEAYRGLLTCLRALSSIAYFCFYAQPLYRLLTQTCQSLGIQLPKDILDTLDWYRSDEWTKNAANLVSSQYVADMRKLATNIDNERMDSVISRWDTLAIEENGSASSSRSPPARSGEVSEEH